MEIKISTFTDESGQDTKWRKFLVCTAICLSSDQSSLENRLCQIETTSGKIYKWHDSNISRRKKYVSQIIYEKLLKKCEIYFSEYQNKSEYVDLVSSHLVKAINSYCRKSDYQAKIFIDKVNDKTTNNIKKELKLFKIKYKKIRGLRDEGNAIIRLADAACGLIRDTKNKKVPLCYKQFYSCLKEI